MRHHAKRGFGHPIECSPGSDLEQYRLFEDHFRNGEGSGVPARGLQIGVHHTDGKIEGAANFTIKSLQSLEKKIKSIPGVINIEFELTNWRKTGGQWTPKKM